MEYLRLNKSMKVRTSDILYVRKVRETEALGIDRDGPITGRKGAAVIVLRNRKAPRIISPVSFETLMERMAFVDIGENRYVPVPNIAEICWSPEEFEGKRFRTIWLKDDAGGYAGVMGSNEFMHVLEARLNDAQRKQARIVANAEMAERVKAKLLERRGAPRIEISLPLSIMVPETGFGMAA